VEIIAFVSCGFGKVVSLKSPERCLGRIIAVSLFFEPNDTFSTDLEIIFFNSRTLPGQLTQLLLQQEF
jgi:hypothetical protein